MPARKTDVAGRGLGRKIGANPDRIRLIVVLAATLGTAAAVAVSNLIVFVGIIVPHVVRLLAGSSARVVLPLSLLFGGAFLALTDLAARTVLAPADTHRGGHRVPRGAVLRVRAPLGPAGTVRAVGDATRAAAVPSIPVGLSLAQVSVRIGERTVVATCRRRWRPEAG
ncbi:MAG: iron chelate uptake ABC transporter family permease subunit [Acidimicrobiales bacterium]